LASVDVTELLPHCCTLRFSAMASASRLALLAFLAAPAVGITVQRNVTDPDLCKCLSYKSVYAQTNFSCEAAGEELCNGLYKKLKEAVCMKPLGDESYEKQTCLVDSRCENLNGGFNVGAVSFKYCTPGEDDMLMNWSPWRLGMLALRRDIDGAQLAMLAYRSTEGFHWHEARDFLVSNGTNTEGLGADVQEYLQKIKDSKKPYFVPGLDTTPMGVVYGEKIYEITFNTDYSAARQQDGRSMLLHPSMATQTECVAGC